MKPLLCVVVGGLLMVPFLMFSVAIVAGRDLGLPFFLCSATVGLSGGLIAVGRQVPIGEVIQAIGKNGVSRKRKPR